MTSEECVSGNREGDCVTWVVCSDVTQARGVVRYYSLLSAGRQCKPREGSLREWQSDFKVTDSEIQGENTDQWNQDGAGELGK